MTRSADWPDWLTTQPEQLNVLQALGAAGFVWSLRNEPPPSASVIYGRWAPDGRPTEVNVALRGPRNDQASTSVAGVYPRSGGFWHGGREPEMVESLQRITGTVGEVLDMAKTWAETEHP